MTCPYIVAVAVAVAVTSRAQTIYLRTSRFGRSIYLREVCVCVDKIRAWEMWEMESSKSGDVTVTVNCHLCYGSGDP